MTLSALRLLLCIVAALAAVAAAVKLPTPSVMPKKTSSSSSSALSSSSSSSPWTREQQMDLIAEGEALRAASKAESHAYHRQRVHRRRRRRRRPELDRVADDDVSSGNISSGGDDVRPTVVLHGVNDHAARMDLVVSWIRADFPSMYILNAEIGDGKHDSMWLDVDTQVDKFAAVLAADARLHNVAGGVNLVCYSQGGVICRAYVERYGNAGLSAADTSTSSHAHAHAHARATTATAATRTYPRVHNLITWSGPHGGVSVVPVVSKNGKLQRWLEKVIGEADTDSKIGRWLQQHVSIAGYWRDQWRVESYERNVHFLPDINNQRRVVKGNNTDTHVRNATYTHALESLNALQLIWTPNDKIVQPPLAAAFAVFAPNTNNFTDVIPLRQRALYLNNDNGLRSLDRRGRLYINQTDLLHHQYPDPIGKKWYERFTRPLLG